MTRWTPSTPEVRLRDRFFAEFATATVTQKHGFALLFKVLGERTAAEETLRFKADLQAVFAVQDEALAEKERV